MCHEQSSIIPWLCRERVDSCTPACGYGGAARKAIKIKPGVVDLVQWIRRERHVRCWRWANQQGASPRNKRRTVGCTVAMGLEATKGGSAASWAPPPPCILLRPSKCLQCGSKSAHVFRPLGRKAVVLLRPLSHEHPICLTWAHRSALRTGTGHALEAGVRPRASCSLRMINT